MKTLKTYLKAPIFREMGDLPPLPPPVQEGNLNCHAEENLTALRWGEGTHFLRFSLYLKERCYITVSRFTFQSIYDDGFGVCISRL